VSRVETELAGHVDKHLGGALELRAAVRPEIREIVAGRRYLSHVINAQVINDYVRRMQGDPLDPYETLTARERQVLRLATAGSTTAEIAQQIGISLRTAEHHRANLMRKLKLHTVSDLIQYARQRGLIPDV